METLSYQFENQEDREMAFHNIVKWYGDAIVERVEILELSVEGPRDIQPATRQIVEKHLGKPK